MAERAAAGRAAEEPRDPTGHYHEVARELADRVDRNVGDVLDDWDHAAAIYQYEAGVDRATAEERAWRDTRERYEAQRSLL